jgi:hypothetical protein
MLRRVERSENVGCAAGLTPPRWEKGAKHHGPRPIPQAVLFGERM